MAARLVARQHAATAAAAVLNDAEAEATRQSHSTYDAGNDKNGGAKRLSGVDADEAKGEGAAEAKSQLVVRLPRWITPRLLLLTCAALLAACLLGGCFFAWLFGCCCSHFKGLGPGSRRASGPRHERLRAVDEGCDAYDDDEEEGDHETHSL